MKLNKKVRNLGIILGVIVGIAVGCSNTENTTTSEVTPSNQKVEAAKGNDVIEEQEKVKEENKTIEDCAKEVFGDDFEQMTANENMITVEIYVETFWSTDTLAKSYKYDTLSFFKKIKNKDELKNYDTVKIICNAAGTDKYGNDIKILALSSTYSTDDIANINFENMTAERLYDNFDQQKFVHPAMNS